jgi:hypothetical protein
MKNNFAFNPLQIIFTLVGAGMLIAGYFSAPGSLTDDGYPLNIFFYCMGSFFIILPLVLFGLINRYSNRAAKRITYLKEQGIKGKGRVLHMRRTGLTVNDVPQVILDLNITTDLGEHFSASYKKCIDPIYYSLIRPDTDLLVYVDPSDKEKVYVDFEEAWAKLARGTTGPAEF